MKRRINFILGSVVVGLLVFSWGSLLGQADPQKEGEKMSEATFAGGCFWSMAKAFEAIEGVQDVVSGYAGGVEDNPTYQDYAQKGYVEAVRVIYDPAKASYSDLLNVFWQQIDPTDEGGQFVDRGYHYSTAIFYHDADQKKLAEESKKILEASGIFSKPIVTSIIAPGKFFAAEDYHQDYYKTHPLEYNRYRAHSGRDQYLKKVWGKNSKLHGKGTICKYPRASGDEIKKKLSPLQYKVTQEGGTERPFNNEYWDNKKEGIYVDVVSGEPLFSSIDKFDSGTGWPSFTKPLEEEHVVEKEDKSLWTARTEVRSKSADSHLGHMFSDGPAPTGMRFCINSAALRFIPKEKLEQEGYGQYKSLFQ